VVARAKIRTELGSILRMLMGKSPMVIGDLPAPAKSVVEPGPAAEISTAEDPATKDGAARL
jgi:hypothetical protein